MTYEKEIDVDLFNQEQRPTELCWDCLEFGAYLKETWKIDTSDEDYERWRDEQAEGAEDAYKEKLELEFD